MCKIWPIIQAKPPGSPLGLIRIEVKFWVVRFHSSPNCCCGESNTRSVLPSPAPITTSYDILLIAKSSCVEELRAMGRGRGKGKKLTVTSHEDPGSGEEEKIPVQKRRGRPQKPLKDETEDEEIKKLDEEDSENKCKDSGSITSLDNVKKRKKSSPTKEEDAMGVGPTLVAEFPTKPNGFRHIGSRRKSKPRRAAEVGVEC